MKINLKVLQRELREIANKHEQIGSFFWGDFVRFYESKQVKHRALICTLVRIPTASRTRTTINLILTIADRCFVDFRNLDDVQSDAAEILNDIITIINRSPRWRSFLTGEISPSIEFFQERGGDMVAGAFASVNFNINNQSDICSIPILDYDFEGDFASSCFPALFLINGVEVATVESGGVKEIKVLDTLGNETGAFDGTAWIVQPSVCPDATVENSNQSFVQNIPASDTFILPDTTYNITVAGVAQPPLTLPTLEDTTININWI